MKKRFFTLFLACLLLISLLPAAVLAEGNDPQPDPEAIETETQRIVLPEIEKGTTDLFAGFVKRQMGKHPYAGTPKSSGAGEAFSGQTAALYQAFVAEIHKIAVGERASASIDIWITSVGTGEPIVWTAAELGVDTITDTVFREQVQSMVILFYYAFKADCAWDLYWHNVASGFRFGWSKTISSDGKTASLYKLTIKISVDTAYQNGDEFTMNTTIGQRVVTAGNTARGIVEQYKNASDYNKLRGYNSAICSMVTYDHDAAEALGAGAIDHGDPWQLIWAFDNDDTTNIVCEGYSKAFQHLCDLTTFASSKVRSIIVSGNAGGAHMWNLVRMEDDRTYLMDVTWSDGYGESGGSYESFFLKTADGGSYPSFEFYNGTRTYDEEIQQLYGEEKLTVSSQAYSVPPVSFLEQPRSVTADNGQTVTFKVRVAETVSYQWYGKAPDAANWTKLINETGNTLTVVASAANNGWQYFCLVRVSYDDEFASDTATLTVNIYPPVITKEPEAITVDSGKTATFRVEATGRNLTYQWYTMIPADGVWLLMEGEASSTLSVVASVHNNGWMYRCVVKNNDGEAISAAVELHVNLFPPVIVTQPQDVTADNGTTAAFTVVATGKELSYYWLGLAPEYSEDDWRVMDSDTATLTVPADREHDGWKFMCQVSDEEGLTNTRVATLTVAFHPPVITKDPQGTAAKSGAAAKFTVTATGKDLSYQWFKRIGPEEDWFEMAGETKATLTFTAAMVDDGSQYFCKVSNPDGSTDSAAASLEVIPQLPVIKTQPKSAKVKSGANVKFSVKATGPNLQYRWFSRPDANTPFAEMAGETKAELNLVASMALNGMQYCCEVRNADGAETTDIVILTVTPVPASIKTQPKDATVKSGSKAKFSVKATGPSLQYQWYERASADAQWTEIEGAVKADCTITASMVRDGSQYYCKVWNEDDSMESNPATLTVTPVPAVIKTQPKDATVKSGAKAKFSVKASGPNLQYQWYEKAPDGGQWVEVEGAVKAEYSFKSTMARNGYQYRCRVWNDDETLESNAATLTVTPVPPKFGTQPKDAKVKLGEEAKFKVKASNGTVSYQWYYRTSEDGEWKVMNGETGTILVVVAEEGNIGWQFFCRATNEEGSTDSKIATLKLK